jgi:hypothetical protein
VAAWLGSIGAPEVHHCVLLDGPAIVRAAWQEALLVLKHVDAVTQQLNGPVEPAQPEVNPALGALRACMSGVETLEGIILHVELSAVHWCDPRQQGS